MKNRYLTFKDRKCMMKTQVEPASFLYNENHAIVAWFEKG